MERLSPQNYIVDCGKGDPVLEKLGVVVTEDHSDIQPGAAFFVPIDADQILPAQRKKIVPVVYYELATNYDDALEGQTISEHVFRIDCRDKLYAKAEAIRAAMVNCLRRGGRLAREGSRFDAFEPGLVFYRRIQEIVIEP